VTFLTVPGVGFVLHFSALFSSPLNLLVVVIIAVPHLFYTLRIRKILQVHRAHRRMNFNFLSAPFLFARSAAQKWNGKVRQPKETHLSPGGFLKKREPRVPETAVDTQLGFGQI
jgi:hypothetical protein